MKLKNPKHISKTLEALGIDPLEGDYHFDGEHLEVDGKTDADIKAAEASLDIAALEDEEALKEAHAKRAAAYPPIGDQLDAILKQINYMRMNGTDMIQEMDDVLNDWLDVKRKHPKRE